jgi:hypothetical protein
MSETTANVRGIEEVASRTGFHARLAVLVYDKLGDRAPRGDYPQVIADITVWLGEPPKLAADGTRLTASSEKTKINGVRTIADLAEMYLKESAA